MKLSLVVGVHTTKTLLTILSSEAKVLSTKKLDTNDPCSSEELPVLRGDSNLVHVGSTSATTLFNETTIKKKAIEYIPLPQGEFTEVEYDLGVLACATSTSTNWAFELLMTTSMNPMAPFSGYSKTLF